MYYDLLNRVRRTGDWEAWLDFFLEGVRVTAEGAVDTARRLSEMFASDRVIIERSGRRASSALRVHEALKEQPIQSLSRVRARTGLSFPTVSSAMRLLVKRGIAREITGRSRDRLFVYDRYVAHLAEGPER